MSSVAGGPEIHVSVTNKLVTKNTTLGVGNDLHIYYLCINVQFPMATPKICESDHALFEGQVVLLRC